MEPESTLKSLIYLFGNFKDLHFPAEDCKLISDNLKLLVSKYNIDI